MNAVPKMQPVRDRKYLNFLHDAPCLITGACGHDGETVDPAHLGAFKGMKRGDDETLPILHRFHKIGHDKGEMTMWRENLPDYVLLLALRAYAREMYADYQRAQSEPTQRPSSPTPNTSPTSPGET